MTLVGRPLALVPIVVHELLGISAVGAADRAVSPLDGRVADIRALFSANSGGYEKLFTQSFLDQVPGVQLTGVFVKYHADLGRCTEAVETERKDLEGKWSLLFERGYSVPVSVSVEAAAPHLIKGLWIGGPVRLAASLEVVAAEIKALPGEVSFLVAELANGAPKSIAEVNPDRALAIGSAFKLYILAELVRAIGAGTRRWTDVVDLEAGAVSLPSGILQEWPVGSSLTLHSLATLMISRSDNTATDQLLRALGRQKVEEIQAATGHASAARNVPFLSTLELFKLKGDRQGKAAAAYLAKPAAARRAYLESEVARMSREDLVFPDKPAHVETLEWFASAADLCRVMDWIRKQTDKSPAVPARALLGVNPGVSSARGKWRTIGYKGGSEPGVLNLTFLVESARGRWYALAATWNDRTKPVDEGKLIALVERALQLLAERS